LAVSLLFNNKKYHTVKKILYFLLVSLLSLPLFAQRTNTRDYVSISFEPDHADWTYRCGDKVKINMSVRRHYCAVPNQDVTYYWGPDQRPADEEKTISTGKTGVISLTLKGSKTPGFRTLKVKTTLDGVEYSNLIKLAFEPENIRPTAELPTDFMEFWQKAIEKSRKTPLCPLFTRKSEYDTPFCDVYEVRFQNMKKGSYLYGTLAVPKGVNPTDSVATRRYPVVLLWPGAGVKSHRGETTYFPEQGVITLEMGIHGISVTQPEGVYTDLVNGSLSGYSTILSPRPELYYYYNVYAGTVKTVDFLCSLPFVDAERIGVFGGSQGGALSLVTAALDERVRCISIAYPAMAEIAGYYRGRAEGWPHMFCTDKTDKATDALVRVADYYDVLNFARFVRQPMLFFLGFNDITCCPTSTYATYNVLPGEKQLVTPLDCGHWMYPQFHQQRHEWLVEQLNK